MKVAVLFPGQGSQCVGMGLGFWQGNAAARAVLEQVDPGLGRGLTELMFKGPEEALKETSNTQPALYAAGLASLAALRAEGISFGACAGHSLGEYCALQAAGVFSFVDGLKLVQARASAMALAAAGNPGTMAAVLKMEDADVERACASASQAGPVSAANYNCPGQLVISGSAEGVAEAMRLCKEAGGRVIPLAVSGPFHSPAMAQAGASLKEAFQAVAWSAPQAPVLANVDAQVSGSVPEIQSKLVAQISAPVRWTQTILALKGLGFTHYVEAGPGKVLAGLVKKTDPGAWTCSVGDPESLKAAVDELKKAEEKA